MLRRLYGRWVIVILVLLIAGGVCAVWWNQQQQPCGDYRYMTEFTLHDPLPPEELQSGLLFLDYHTLELYGWNGQLKWRRSWIDPTPGEEWLQVRGGASQDGRTSAVIYGEGKSSHVRAWRDDRQIIDCLVPIEWSETFDVSIWHTGEILITQEAGHEIYLWAIDKRGIRAKGTIHPSRPLTQYQHFNCFQSNDERFFLCFAQNHNDLVSLAFAGNRIITHTQPVPDKRGEEIFSASHNSKGATSYDMSDADWHFPYPERLENGSYAPSIREVNWASHGRYAMVSAVRPQFRQTLLERIVQPGTPFEFQLFERPGQLRARLRFSTDPRRPAYSKHEGRGEPFIRFGWQYYLLIDLTCLSPDAKYLVMPLSYTRRNERRVKYVVFSLS